MDEMMRCCLEFELMGVHEAMHVVGGPGYSHGKKGTFGGNTWARLYLPAFSIFTLIHRDQQQCVHWLQVL